MKIMNLVFWTQNMKVLENQVHKFPICLKELNQ